MTRRLLVLATVLGAAGARADVTVAPGYAVRTISTPDVVQGGVVQRDGVVVVGQGAFGAGLQRIVRIAGPDVVTIATGFSSLGGFALAPDGTLYVVDNGGDLPGATSGDTLYAIPDALTRPDAVAAADAEVVPSGTFPFAQDVERLPDGRLLVSESVGPGAGRVALVDGTSVSPRVDGLDYASGLALQGQTFLVANVDGSFVGSVRRFGFDSIEQSPVASSLSGAFALAIDGDDDVLVSGGVADDFSSTVIAVDGTGAITERARGFAFTAELFYDPVADETLVLDSGVTQVTAICRDRDGDGTCDAGAGCSEATSLSMLVRTVPRVSAPLPASGRLYVRVRLGFAGNLPRAEPKQTGFAVRMAGVDGVVFDLVVPGGNGWSRSPAGGWRYGGPVEGAPSFRAKARVEKESATLLFKTVGTVRGASGIVTQARLGDVCATTANRCLLTGTPRRKPATRYRLICR